MDGRAFLELVCSLRLGEEAGVAERKQDLAALVGVMAYQLEGGPVVPDRLRKSVELDRSVAGFP